MSELHIFTSTEIAQHLPALALKITDLHYRKSPELEKIYGAAGRAKCLHDAQYHLSYLSEAIGSESPLLFSEYCAWAKHLLMARNIPVEDLEMNLACMAEVLNTELKEEQRELAGTYIDTALNLLREIPTETTSFIKDDDNEPYGLLSREYLQYLLNGKRQKASQLIMKSVENGIPVKDIYENVFEKSQYEIGRLWQLNKINVGQEHYCTAATELIMSQLYNYIISDKQKNHSIVSACVEGDYHEIGIRMVSDFFEMEGWDTFHLGANTPTPSLLKILEEQQPDIVLLSATMTYHVQILSDVIKKIRANDQLQSTKIMVGGYPFKLAPKLWQKVGADGFAKSASQALEKAEELISN
ncbi:MAG: cobalamin-dependent protein [Bacteroidia bacterium]